MWGKIIQSALSIFSTFTQNARDAELKADGARKAELERRDELDKVKERADAHRSKNNSATDADVIDRL